MTQLALHRDLSYCQVDGHLVFLDIQNDRYFRLSAPLESALVACLHGAAAPHSSVRRLIQLKVLSESSIDFSPPALLSEETPSYSPVEDSSLSHRPNVNELLGTFAAVFRTHRKLKARGLKRTLEDMASLRAARSRQSSHLSLGDAHLLKAADAFRRARLYVPIDTCCLLDSVAMITFLAMRRLHANLVFGVAIDPFSAHCWVQHGDSVLNDALGHVLAFTPIRAI